MCLSKAVNTTQKPLILAVETSSRTGSVAIAIGAELLAETVFSGPMRHSAELFTAISGLMERFALKPRQIEQIHTSIGPGSFTGLRIAATLAKMMHLANGAGVVAVDTMDVIAANLDPSILDTGYSSVIEHQASSRQLRAARVKYPVARIGVVLDAKRNQFFVAVYEYTSDTTCKKVVPDSLMAAAQFVEEFARTDEPIWLLGDGLLYHRDKFQTEGIYFLDERLWSPRASKVHLLGWQKALAGQFAEPMTLQPYYLRKPDVTMKKDWNSKCKM